jgi:uncharacterized protein (TIGR03437 family)
MMSKTLLVFLFASLLLAQKSPFSTSTPQPVKVSYNLGTNLLAPAPSATTTAQLVVLTSAQLQTYQITPASISSPPWLQYAIAPSSAQGCSAVPDSAYRFSTSSPATGNTINLCVRGMSTPPLARGNYLGTITIAPAGPYFVPFNLFVELSSAPTGYLQLFTVGDVPFGGTINIAVLNGTLALSPVSVVCDVFNPGAVTLMDLHGGLMASSFVPYTLTPADWVVLKFSPTSSNPTSPSNLSFSIDPVNAKNQPDLSAVVVINSLSPYQGQDFVWLRPDNIISPLPTLSVNPNPISLTAIAGSNILANQTVMVSTNGLPVNFTVAATTSDGGNWLSFLPPTGPTPSSFTVVVDPSRLVAKTYTGTVTITASDASDSPPLSIPVNAIVIQNLPLPSINGVVNAASNTAPVAPGSWVSIYGSNLSPQVPSGIDWSGAIINNKLPLVLYGVSATIDNKSAAIGFVKNNQINVQAPSDSNSGPVNVVVTTSNGVSQPGVVMLQPIAPALFMNGTTMYPAAQFADFSTVSSTHPAHPGDAVILYGTGFGPTSPAYTTGVVLSGSARLTNAVTATLGNIPAQVDFAGIIAPGLYQINIRVPASAGAGDQPLVLSINAIQTQSNVFLPVIR